MLTYVQDADTAAGTPTWQGCVCGLCSLLSSNSSVASATGPPASSALSLPPPAPPAVLNRPPAEPRVPLMAFGMYSRLKGIRPADAVRMYSTCTQECQSKQLSGLYSTHARPLRRGKEAGMILGMYSRLAGMLSGCVQATNFQLLAQCTCMCISVVEWMRERGREGTSYRHGRHRCSPISKPLPYPAGSAGLMPAAGSVTTTAPWGRGTAASVTST
jgi:hypothetical protein